MPYGIPRSATNAHVSSGFPPPLKNEKSMVLSNLSSKKATEINYFDDYCRTSGSPFLPCFMAGKNRWGGKGIKRELDFLVQGITAYYKSKHLVICLSLKPLWFSALCHSDMMWAEPGPGCVFTFPLENVWRSTITSFLPSRTLPGWGRPGLLGRCPSNANLLWWVLHSPHGPLQLESLLLKYDGI